MVWFPLFDWGYRDSNARRNLRPLLSTFAKCRSINDELLHASGRAKFLGQSSKQSTRHPEPSQLERLDVDPKRDAKALGTRVIGNINVFQPVTPIEFQGEMFTRIDQEAGAYAVD